MIRPYIKRDVKGPPGPIVVVSEGTHVDRAVFNFITHILYDRPCESTEEIEKVWSIMSKSDKQIGKLLGSMDVTVESLGDRKFTLIEMPSLLHLDNDQYRLTDVGEGLEVLDLLKLGKEKLSEEEYLWMLEHLYDKSTIDQHIDLMVKMGILEAIPIVIAAVSYDVVLPGGIVISGELDLSDLGEDVVEMVRRRILEKEKDYI